VVQLQYEGRAVAVVVRRATRRWNAGRCGANDESLQVFFHLILSVKERKCRSNTHHPLITLSY